ncbi:sigma-70 family RNA polymerase sigma factor [Pseudoflavitalea sp. G-6-1-2]|uniref:sigma-70 family RNA polymerase sigma factor n=1 Tax=Pseudoflavitalea sp. G-6-1-2 TaxID=2728841 RepID=UPI00146C694C|nr:sigma-70 family RNA polymerase sigma factor [Pseudoflavitalea sp. G-6-1-2]NML22994.1 sigma-70 family RNA polymerase sigma factor [Pseudoflavitalea sp. G-6-1-2]
MSPVTHMVKDEQQLLHQIVQGSERAFCSLMAVYERPLILFIERHVDNTLMAEEIVQDIFLKIWLTREALASVKNFRSWLFVIARNHALSCLRSQIRLRNRHSAWLDYAGMQPDESNADAANSNIIDLIEQAIAALPDQQRRAFELARRKGLTYRAAADEMGLSPETIKKYLQHATSSVAEFVKARSAGIPDITIALILLNIFFHRP